ncbi:ribonuclease H-like domain-containing protein, partial [Tanacetum coccineum]
GDVLRRLISNNVIYCNKEKPPVLCHDCQLGKHVRLPFASSNTVVTSCFDIIHSDVWTSPIPSLSGFKYYFVLFRTYVLTQFKCEIRSFQCDHGGEFDNRNLHKLFAKNGIQFRFSCPKTSQPNEGADVDETFSLVVKPSTIRNVLSLAGSRHWPIHQLDCKNAFLHSDLSETVYMHQPSEFRDFVHPDYTWVDTAYLLLYVDDIVLTASSQALLQQIITSLHKEFVMTDSGSLNYILGIFVTRDSSGIFLSQKKYVVEILERAHMVNCNPSRTPVAIESKLGIDGDPISDPTLYRSLAGSLQYLTFFRPDISYAVQHVCLYMHDHREPHFLAFKRILRRRFLVLVQRQSIVVLPMLLLRLVGCGIFYCAKYIEIDIHFVRDLVVGAAGQVRVLHVPSRYQFADIFTKGLPSALFEEFRTSLSVRCPPAPTTGVC